MIAIDARDVRIAYEPNGSNAPHGPTASSDALAVGDVDLCVHAGEFVALIGPSGCGKTTLLNALAGLLPDGAIQTGRIELAPSLRADGALGYLTQDDTMLPWRSVVDNVALPLEIHGIKRHQRRERAAGWLRSFGLDGFETSYPHELSGGMRQRALLARTLIYEPRWVLLDEPLGSLDAQTRVTLQDELLRVRRATDATFVLVTHDLEEALTLADRVVALSPRPARVATRCEVSYADRSSAFDLRLSRQFSDLYRRLWRELYADGTATSASEHAPPASVQAPTRNEVTCE